MPTRRLAHIKGDRIRAVLPPQARLSKDPETTRKMLEKYDESERSYRTKWRSVILTTPISVPGVKAAPWEPQHALTLGEEIMRCWIESGWCYTYGSFQAATLMICVVVELAIERYLRSKDLWSEYQKQYSEDQRTFGSLLGFCRGSKKRGMYLTPSILEKCGRLNRLRVEAAHMNIRRNATLKIHPTAHADNDMDETEDVTIEENGQKSVIMDINELGVLIDNVTGDFYKVRAFKLYATEALSLASDITKRIYALY